MKLLELLKSESSLSLRTLVLTAGVSGASSAGILAVINVAAANAAVDSQSVRYAAMFAVIMALYILSQKHILAVTASEVEKILDHIRVRIADKARHCNLETLERIGHADVYACVSKDTRSISEAAAIIVLGLQSTILVVFTLLYIAWLSLAAFALCLAFICLVISILSRNRKGINELMHAAMDRENRFLDAMTDLLHGFKEVRMNRARSADLHRHAREISAAARDLKIRAEAALNANFIFGQTAFYLLLAAIVFVVPQLSESYSDVVIKTTTAMLFLFGPISTLIGSVPALTTANAACENITALE
ncbi:MAG: hypothetical protein M3Z21_07415, partial [Pseudomonadota bacterium]|nr:hypothetical protein [Pseudomonadota bacterium]